MYMLSDTVTIDGDVASIWDTMTDAANWATWDPHFLSCGFEGPFEVGGTGWTVNRIVSGKASHFTLLKVDKERGFTTRSPIPFGQMLIINKYEPEGEGRVRVTRTSEVYGPFALIFRYFRKQYRHDVQLTFAALEQEAARRAAQARSAG
ncbi:SRPBCC family protein [Sphaerisporangium dianthi]|uniref:SRPBCC family protein n=1 Tax=Sphaerisporangium dianthi TaxID=1436120 RepID=A0ABV9CQY7_9ACTN